MAVTGTGTQADPFIVHNYTEFMSLSNHVAVEDSSVYIQFFDDEHPNQTIDCNTYGSEFKWGQFVGKADVTTYINLNGCTIKNFLIDSDCTMFYAVGFNDTMPRWHAAKIEVSNGSIRNVFMASASSKLIYGEVTLRDVSVSMNVAGTTEIPISGIATGKPCYIDNCALYLVASTLYTKLIRYTSMSDTDVELHVANMNQQLIISGCKIVDCRFQGKIAGQVYDVGGHVFVILAYNYGDGFSGDQCEVTNSVFDMDASGVVAYWGGSEIAFYTVRNSATYNTNVFCNSHGLPDSYHFPSVWNYMDHEHIRNGTYLNDQGFTVVEVVGS